MTILNDPSTPDSVGGVNSQHGNQITLISSAGVEAGIVFNGSHYQSRFGPLTMALLAANSYMWCMRNSVFATTDVHILSMGFNLGITAASATTYQAGLFRYRDDDFSGGVELAIPQAQGRLQTISNPSKLSDLQQASAAAFTIGTHMDIGGSILAVALPRSSANGVSVSSFVFHVAGEPHSDLILHPGEGIALKLLVASVAGDQFGGYINWLEK